ncbi:MAG: redoxin domain-containing protein [Gemmatimonadetes bacterium]|nr:redoxin domain-containing protein [Gemmatimonadota bacterium]
MSLPFPALVDRDRATYRAYGLIRAMHLWQESATFLIDRHGVVRHAVHAHNPAASMEWDGLLAALRGLAEGDEGDEGNVIDERTGARDGR